MSDDVVAFGREVCNQLALTSHAIQFHHSTFHLVVVDYPLFPSTPSNLMIMRPPRSLHAVGTPVARFSTRTFVQPRPFAFRANLNPIGTQIASRRAFASDVRSQLRRFASFDFPPRPYQKRHPYISLIARLALSSVLGVTVLVGAILAHDAFTYSERHTDRVPTNPLALQPRRGGKKNLPILEANLDSEEDEVRRAMQDKPRLVIVGGGWGVSDTSHTNLKLTPGCCDAVNSAHRRLQRHTRLAFHLLCLYASAPLGLCWNCRSEIPS